MPDKCRIFIGLVLAGLAEHMRGLVNSRANLFRVGVPEDKSGSLSRASNEKFPPVSPAESSSTIIARLDDL